MGCGCRRSRCKTSCHCKKCCKKKHYKKVMVPYYKTHCYDYHKHGYGHDKGGYDSSSSSSMMYMHHYRGGGGCKSCGK